jgi:hypothetical protein
MAIMKKSMGKPMKKAQAGTKVPKKVTKKAPPAYDDDMNDRLMGETYAQYIKDKKAGKIPLDPIIQRDIKIKNGIINPDGTPKTQRGSESNMSRTPMKKGGMIKKKMKMGGAVKKAQNGTSFAKLAPPYDKATYADKIAGATKGKAKNGTKMKKAMMGTAMTAAPIGMMKKGGSMKKCKYGCK